MPTPKDQTFGALWRYPGPRGTVWRIRYRDASGRRVLETLGSEPEWNKRKAAAELRRRQVDVERAGYSRPEQTILADFARAWLSDYLPARGLKPTTLAGYRHAIEGHLVPALGAVSLTELERQLPDVHNQLLSAATTLEQYGRNAQDIEFTVEAGKLWLLQTRAAKRSPQAAVRIAVRLAEEGVIDRAEAVAMVTPSQLMAATAPHVDPVAKLDATILAAGLPACPGVATGRVVGDCEEAEDFSDDGVDVVLARPTTDPDDVSGMVVAVAVITEIGGSTSHAAVVSRELGKPCVVGCGQGTLTDLLGRTVTVDGTSGEIFDGVLPLADSHSPERDAAQTLREWAKDATNRVRQ